MIREPTRPDPDRLLAQSQAAGARAARGKLKIFFGASAGVGKTYAMLKTAQQLRRQQVDVVAGVIETHGRQETAELLIGIDVLPMRPVTIKDRTLEEFDLDAALARKPGVLLVDELAHSNLAGSRHPRRWQDIDELLDAGIDVLTTMNVQHLESLNDVVGGITGIRVWETVPDHVFDRADEVVLVDLSTDELLKRLKAGKIYLPAQAERAVQNFFRRGNLMALRELALRRTAERVDDDVRSYRREIDGGDGRQVWHVSDALLVAIGAEGSSDRIVRAASRRAGRSNAPWHAVYVETPALQRLPEARRSAILRTLKLAESLGAITATLSSEHGPEAIVAYAREHNLGTVVVGRARAASGTPAGGAPDAASGASWLRRRRSAIALAFGAKPFAARVAALAPEVELMVVARDEARAAPRSIAVREDDARPRIVGYAWALGSSALVALVATPLLPIFDLANIVMLFMLAVVGVAMKFGRGPALAAALINVLAFDFFFVPPRFTFAVQDAQYLLTFVVMIIVGLVVGQLTASLRYQARVANDREQRARNLYEMARELGKALSAEQVAEISDRAIESAFRAKVAVLLADEHDRLQVATVGAGADPGIDLGLAQWAFDHAEAAGTGTDTLPASRQLYVPLKAPMRTRGVIAIEPSSARLLMIPEQRQLLDTYAALAAIAIERVHFVTVAQETLLSMESERLRNSLLAALSHDLRTPLTAMVGMSQTLAQSLARSRPQSLPASLPSSPDGDDAASAQAIAEQAMRTAQLVDNLLDMARLQAGAVTLRRDWQSLEELAGTSIRSIEAALAAHPIRIALDPALPLIYGDGVLLERVLVNLFENAAKYTPAGTPITLSARRDGAMVVIDLADDGPGLPGHDVENLFRKFSRGDKESSTSGVGLGLAICRAIVEAHGGGISAANRAPPAHGAVVTWTLPHRDAPAMTAPDAAALAAPDALAAPSMEVPPDEAPSIELQPNSLPPIAA